MLRVSFRFYDDTPITNSKVSVMTDFLASNATDGFKTKLNNKMSTAGLSYFVVDTVIPGQTSAPTQPEVPHLSVMPTFTHSSRRIEQPYESMPYETMVAQEETMLPGGVEDSISISNKIL